MRILRLLLCLCLALSLIGPAQARVVQAESDATLTAGLVMADLHNVISGQVDALGGEGAPAHVIAHGLVGCAVAELQGADCGAGAVGGMVSAFYAGGIDRNGGLDEDQRAAATTNAEMIGAVAGYLVSGGKAENVSQAAAISQSAFKNNYLTVADISALERALDACEKQKSGCSAADINALIDEYRLLSLRRDEELIQECQSDLVCINQRLGEVAAVLNLETIRRMNPQVAHALVAYVEPNQMTWQKINANIELHHFYEHMCGTNAECLSDPIEFHEVSMIERSLGELASDYALSFYRDSNGDVVVVETAIGVINAGLGLVEIAVPEAARVMASKQFVLSATGEVITLFQSEDPARQAFVSSAALAGGVSGGRIGVSMCGGGFTLTGWACGALLGSAFADAGGRVAGLAYDLGLEVNRSD